MIFGLQVGNARFRSFFRLEHFLLALSVVIFFWSLKLPAFVVHLIPDDSISGSSALFGGLFQLLAVGGNESIFYSCAWLANIAFFMAITCLLVRQADIACVLATAALVLSGSFSLAKESQYRGACETHPISLQVGYFVWVLSMSLMFGSAILAIRAHEGSGVLTRHGRSIVYIVAAALAYLAIGEMLPRGILGLRCG